MLTRVVAAAIAVAALVFTAAPAAQAQDHEDGGEYQRLFDEGISLLTERKYDEAVESFKKAIALEGKLPEAYYNIACAYSLKGDKEKAIEWLGKSFERGFRDEDHVAKD